jgi:hypothetical protein
VSELWILDADGRGVELHRLEPSGSTVILDASAILSITTAELAGRLWPSA